MKNDEILREWITSIDLAKTRVANSPSLVFLCGGPISKGEEGMKSCRDVFYRYVTSRSNRGFAEQIVLAEKVFDYFQHSAYQDLLRFEEDIAELAAMTVIFSESPGAIAELGSFAVLKAVRERLLVVVHEDDAEKPSFIWRGPVLALKHLAKQNEKDDPILVYSWCRDVSGNGTLTEADFADAEDLAETIEEILSKRPQTLSLDVARLGHVMLLMIGMLDAVLIASIEEIQSMLDMLEIKHTRREVEQHLSLLASLDLVVKKHYRHNVYYLPSHRKHWIQWGFRKESTVRDIERWRGKFTDYYLKEGQEQKTKALRSHLRSSSQTEVTVDPATAE